MIYIRMLELVTEDDRVLYKVKNERADTGLNKAMRFYMETEGVTKEGIVRSFLRDLDLELTEYLRFK